MYVYIYAGEGGYTHKLSKPELLLLRLGVHPLAPSGGDAAALVWVYPLRILGLCCYGAGYTPPLSDIPLAPRTLSCCCEGYTLEAVKWELVLLWGVYLARSWSAAAAGGLPPRHKIGCCCCWRGNTSMSYFKKALADFIWLVTWFRKRTTG